MRRAIIAFVALGLASQVRRSIFRAVSRNVVCAVLAFGRTAVAASSRRRLQLLLLNATRRTVQRQNPSLDLRPDLLGRRWQAKMSFGVSGHGSVGLIPVRIESLRCRLDLPRFEIWAGSWNNNHRRSETSQRSI